MDTAKGALDAANGEKVHIGGGCEYFNDDPTPVGPWMSCLDDGTKVTKLCVPGTHDSVARYGGVHAQCQSWTITEQLESGIRAFDLRFRMVGNDMCGHHGPVYQKITFAGVAEQFEDFLNKHPGEVVFVRISGNGCDHDSDRDFKDLLKEKMSKRGCDTCMWQLMQDLGTATLGELRGKIVSFDQCMTYNFPDDTQDSWKIGDPDEKWEQVYSHANKKRTDGVIYLNFMNSQGQCGATWNSPDRMAKRVNGKAHDHIQRFFRPGFYLMDYPGTGLVKRFIDENK